MLITNADTLLTSNRFRELEFFGSFSKKTKKPKPVTRKKISKINKPLEASAAKECTLVRIPDLTKKVPNTLKEKHNIDKKTIHFLSACSPLIYH